MKLPLIRIGNSRGLRLPKSIIEECHISKEVELQIEDKKIILIPYKSKPREGWESKFKKMHEAKDDQLIISESLKDDFKDWEW